MNKKNAFARLLSVLLASVIVFSMFSFAGTAATCTIAYEDKLENGKLTVSVFLMNAADINIVEMSLDSYDSSVLTFEKFDAKQTDLADQVLEGIHECNFQAEDSQQMFIAIWGWSLGTDVVKNSPILNKYHLVNLIFTVKPGAEQQLKGKKLNFSFGIMEAEEDRMESDSYTLTVGAGNSAKPETPTAPATKPTTTKIPMGDADKDGKVTASDARLVLRASVGLETLSADEKKVADVDFDSAITASDARLILRASVGLETLEEKIVHKYSYECTYTEEKIIKAATCKDTGTLQKTCICGKSKTETIGRTDHIPSGEYNYARKPTCESSGSGYERCDFCNADIPGTYKSFDALGHLGNGEYCERCNEVNTSYLPEFGLGETWVVEGNWEFTITDVKMHSFCNSYSNSQEAYQGNYVVLVYYTFKNIGYVGSNGDGLWMSIEAAYDSDGNAAKGYPCTHRTYAEECIVGTKSTRSDAFVLQDYDGSLMIMMDKYDKNSNKRRAVFKIEADQLDTAPDSTEKPSTDTNSSEMNTALTKLCNGNTWKSEVGVNGSQVNPLIGWTLTFNKSGTAKLTTDSNTYNYTMKYIGQRDGCYVFDLNSSNSNVSIVYDPSAGEVCLLISSDMGVFFY